MKNLYLFYGEESYLLQEKINSWKTAFREKHGDYNLSSVNGLKEDAGAIISECETVPFLGEKRLIIIENLPPAVNIKIDEKKANNLLRFVENVPETSVVVFVQPLPDKRTKFYKQLSKIAEIEVFSSLKGKDLSAWANKEINRRGGKILPAALGYLIGKVGNNLWLLNNEINKLIAYADNKPISENDIDKLVIPIYDTNIFKLTDYIGNKKSKEALEILHRLIDGGMNSVQIFNMIIRQFRIFLQIDEVRELSSNQIASNLGLHPFVVQNTLKQIRFFKKPELVRAYQKLLAIDEKLKTGGIKISATNENMFILEIEKFILELAKKGESITN